MGEKKEKEKSKSRSVLRTYPQKDSAHEKSSSHQQSLPREKSSSKPIVKDTEKPAYSPFGGPPRESDYARKNPLSRVNPPKSARGQDCGFDPADHPPPPGRPTGTETPRTEAQRDPEGFARQKKQDEIEKQRDKYEKKRVERETKTKRG